MVVIQSPHSMAACRLQHILQLDCPHQSNVLIEKLSHQILQLIICAEPQFVQGPTKEHERHLMPGPIIDSNIRSPRFVDVSAKLALRALYFLRQNLFDKLLSQLAGFLMPIFKSFIPISHGLLDWWGFFEKLMQLLKIRFECFEFLNFPSSADGFALNGLNQRIVTS